MLNKIARKIINKKTLALETIENVEGGNCLYNFMCHKNAVDYAIKNKHKTLAMVMYKGPSFNNWCIHFINIDSKGKFIDNTLGVWSMVTKYKMIKIIKEDEFWDIDDIFDDYINKINLELPWYILKRVTF